MPDTRRFLQRWSARKRAVEHSEDESPPQASTAAEPVPDDLPPIDELGHGSDFTAFLRQGVPPALRHAALRKAWSSNPAIAGHKPLVDYDWDVHAPGFGALWSVDDPARMAAALVARAERLRPFAPHAAPEAHVENSADGAPDQNPDGSIVADEESGPGQVTGPKPA